MRPSLDGPRIRDAKPLAATVSSADGREPSRREVGTAEACLRNADVAGFACFHARYSTCYRASPHRGPMSLSLASECVGHTTATDYVRSSCDVREPEVRLVAALARDRA